MFIKKSLLVSSFVFVILGICLLDKSCGSRVNFIKLVSIKDFKFINKSVSMMMGGTRENEAVLFILRISRINLVEEVYTMDSSLNNVDLHVQILEGSDIENNSFFLASHSGSGKASYFNRLVELEVGDVIWLEFVDEERAFRVEDKFYIEKDGYFEYSSLESINVLYLITCSLNDSSKQLVVKARLVY